MFSSLVRLKDATIFFQARPLLSHALDTEEFDSLADPRLEKNYVESELYCMIEVAAACVRHSAAKRPRMGQVNILEKWQNVFFFLYWQQTNAQTTDMVFPELLCFIGC